MHLVCHRKTSSAAYRNCLVPIRNGLRNGTISQDERKRLVAKSAEISGSPLFVTFPDTWLRLYAFESQPTNKTSENTAKSAAMACPVAVRRPQARTTTAEGAGTGTVAA